MPVFVVLLCVPWWAAEAGTKVLFSFGKVEVLRANASEWEFVRAGTELNAGDLVRMPPQGLLRLGGDGNWAILAGTHEATLDALVAEARETSPNRNSRRLSPLSPEPEAIDVLPAGDPTLRRSSSSSVRFSDADFAAWKRATRNPNALVREWAQRTVSRYGRSEERSRYPTTRLLMAQSLYEAMREAIEESSPVAMLFPEGDARPVYLYAALLNGANIPFEYVLDESRRPVILLDLAESTSSLRRITANVDLVRRSENDRLAIPVAITPSTGTFLDAWYAAEKSVQSRAINE